jgi:uncharacterized membrane protein
MPEKPSDADRLIYAGLLGLSAAGMVQFIERDRDSLDTGLQVAVHAFAIAIPLLAVGFVNEYLRSSGRTVSVWRNLAAFVGCLAAVIGLGALFFHLGAWSGGIFAACVILAFLLIRFT